MQYNNSFTDSDNSYHPPNDVSPTQTTGTQFPALDYSYHAPNDVSATQTTGTQPSTWRERSNEPLEKQMERKSPSVPNKRLRTESCDEHCKYIMFSFQWYLRNVQASMNALF